MQWDEAFDLDDEELDISTFDDKKKKKKKKKVK